MCTPDSLYLLYKFTVLNHTVHCTQPQPKPLAPVLLPLCLPAVGTQVGPVVLTMALMAAL